jgi:hypothetical protein
VPADADLVFDVRYMPNPHFVPDLKPQTGTDAGVRDYVLGSEEASEFLTDIEPLLRHTLPRYEREGKAYLTIAIGCTGGRSTARWPSRAASPAAWRRRAARCVCATATCAAASLPRPDSATR